MEYVIGVDVGTGSARAALFDQAGQRLALAEQAVLRFDPQPDFVQQSGNDIWQAVCAVVRAVVHSSGAAAAEISGIGFDATCSLVALNREMQPASVSPDGDPEQNIMLWMDHRAIAQAEQINRGGHRVLNFTGGRISPEMEIPKILWLKQERPDLYEQVAHFMDLADFLTFRATGSLIRSSCTTTCKWTYLNHEDGWCRDFFESLGLSDLLTDKRIGEQTAEPGNCIAYLSPQAADELGLHQQVAVSAGMIDAHAGGIGVCGNQPLHTLALITGTSACHMLCTEQDISVPGVWGPYYGAMIPELWLLEGGQSAAGAAVEHVIQNHPWYSEACSRAAAQEQSVYQYLNDRVAELEAQGHDLTRDFHILDYYLGNRSPLAEAGLKAMIVGETLHNNSCVDMAIHYLAVLQAVAYGSRHIIEVMQQRGCRIDRIRMCGGATKNPLWMREHADILGIPVETITEPEAMLLGSAITAARAAGWADSLHTIMSAMTHTGNVIQPDIKRSEFHQCKYRVYRKMHSDFLSYRNIMEG